MMFNQNELIQIQKTLKQAESSLAEFYRFTPREWFNYSYELLTEQDIPSDFPRRDSKVLAEVLRYPPPAGIASLFPAHGDSFYSIMLFDKHILASLSRLPSLPFDRFMLYILTHELVHIARFSHSTNYHLSDYQKMEEEAKVHELTRQVLASQEDDELLEIARRYSSDEYSL